MSKGLDLSTKQSVKEAFAPGKGSSLCFIWLGLLKGPLSKTCTVLSTGNNIAPMQKQRVALAVTLEGSVMNGVWE